jgi:hypothetical protein
VNTACVVLVDGAGARDGRREHFGFGAKE